MSKKRVAFINQRYGLEVNGGSEYYTRLMAEHLKTKYEITILTTKAIDYVTWSNYYEADEERIHDITVKRFPVTRERDMKKFGKINAEVLSKSLRTEQDEQKWVIEQGPVCPDLIEYIKEHTDDYDVFVFVTYLYYTTSVGITVAPEKSILIPTAHDEPYIYFDYFKHVFQQPKAIIYLTEEEKKFVEYKFKNQNIIHDVFAVGIDLPQRVDERTFVEERKIDNYIIYVGRIDESKGCKILFQYFEEYKKRNVNDLKLVLMGKAVMDVPHNEDIVNLGFVSEEEKFNGIASAKALILPSEFESLSISVLEALSIKTPVIVNGKCEVLKGHCIRSNAGLYYKSYLEFEGILNYLIDHEYERQMMGENGKEYVEKDYTWDKVVSKFEGIINRIGIE